MCLLAGDRGLRPPVVRVTCPLEEDAAAAEKSEVPGSYVEPASPLSLAPVGRGELLRITTGLPKYDKY